ncbi:high mobility group B protein 15 [Malania oleifera]|uniref:high mobility group B protein 15 n=1 Tax=Malania oleifera TaxID=397392 RepID=UPI0025AE6F02|nr:high mobility group B protein 15 [Malania oleifera]XP_057959687.1 high mobility group B protein 15 [Malania oleifera]XP_057959688.1 high mobility group B protein 15 [Malania oleifera]XP_057959689.1 high mobility group B protein 15 [Malania oleifera]XP_057959690.1 high mobility group B protein 15 [Malania oleifera]XP_057959691.1 high mobility group B protein 15 [Malania oleifera]XP_057959692.1 high mobility group B protein 15 [Malania oleifera]XP_057959694.1 high mobility group B protein 1
MIEGGVRVQEGHGGGGKELGKASSSAAVNQSPLAVKGVPYYHPYPPPLAKYEDVVASPQHFMSTLEKLHSSMGTKFMIPIIGGKELDLHRLFVEVTSRGGIEKIIRERRWKEVTAVFSFPSTATNASFVLRKYYGSLLHHYEQIYYFKARVWTPFTADALQNPCVTPTSAHVPIEHAVPSPEQRRIKTREFLPAASLPSAGSPVIGVIDGKFESGYLVTVTIGSEKLKGVLYQAPSQNAACQVPQYFSVLVNNNDSISTRGVTRRRRRRKSEIKRRDPAHPKPNRSGYNFFFAEQHARLKPLHPGKDREISRMIGELWTKLKENEKAVYQEIAIQDKERYRIEMEGYRERLRGQVISDAVPIQQRLPELDVEMAEADAKIETGEGESPHTPENESSYGKTDTEEDKTMDKDSEMEMSPDLGVGVDSSAAGMETSAEEESFELRKRVHKVGDEGEESLGSLLVETQKDPSVRSEDQ